MFESSLSTIVKAVRDLAPEAPTRDDEEAQELREEMATLAPNQLLVKIEELKGKMLKAAEKLDFERAPMYRDQVKDLEQRHLMIG